MSNFLRYQINEENLYIYDNDSGLIFNIDESLLNIISGERKSESLERDIFHDYNMQYYDSFLKKYDNTCKSISYKGKKKLTIEDIKKHIENFGMKQLIFEITEQCNLRCKYCIYSDKYPYHRNYSKKIMTFEIAKKAIDLYMYYFIKMFQYNPKKRPTFTFYGGEPLLEFKLITKIVEYVIKKYSFYDPMFNITTNGTLLSSEVIQYIAKVKDFYISISLDGPKEEHDRNRVFSKNKGSFDQIFNNLMKIRELYPTLWKNLNFFACYDFGTNIYKVEEFFENVDLPSLIRVSMVEPLFSSYYKRFSLQEKNNFIKTYFCKKKQYIENIKSGEKTSRYSDLLFGTSLFSLYNRFKFYCNNTFFTSFTGTCIPGDKIYVDTEGRIHICEKINSHFSIGDVYTGLDLNKILRLMKKYDEEILTKCGTCPISRVCGGCYATFATKRLFERPEVFCESRIKSTTEDLKDLTEILIHNPTYFRNKYHK